MRERFFLPLAAVFFVFVLSVLLAYPAGYPQILPAADFAWFVFGVIGGRFVFILALAAAAYGIGGAVFGRLLPRFGSLFEEGVFKAASGLILISYLVFLLGLAGFVYQITGYIILIACIAVGARGLLDYLRRVRRASSPPAIDPPAAILAAVSLYFILRGLHGAQLPPTGFDPLMYHLGAPKLYLDAHRIFQTPDVSGSSFPFGVEMLYLLGLMVDGPISANMVNFSFAVLGGLAAALFTRRFLHKASPITAFAVYVSIPMVYWLMPQAYIDLGLAFYTMLALHGVISYFSTKERGWLIIAGLMAGFTMSIKYTGVLVAGIITLGLVVNALFAEKAGARKAAGAAALFAGICAAVSVAWYAKNIIVYSNPFFPFMSGTAGSITGTPYESFWSGGPVAIVYKLISSFWRTSLESTAFKVGWDGGPGPFFLMFIPGIAIFRGIERELKQLMLFTFSLFIAFLVLTQDNLRYMAPFFPAFAVLAAYPVGRLIKEPSKSARIIGLLLVLALGFGALLANTPRDRVESFPSASPAAQDSYYSGQMSGYLASYDTWKWINNNLPADAVIYQLWDDASVYFRGRRTIGSPLWWDKDGRQKLHHIAGVEGFGGFLPGEEIINNLKDMGAGYLLINANREGHALPEDPYFQAHARLILQDKGVFLFQLVP